MASFLHGVTVTEVDSGSRSITTSSSSVIGVVGTAPEAEESDFPLNTPVLISGSYSEAAKLGETGTLPAALNGILAQTGAVVVVVRVEEGEDDAATQANIIGGASADGSYSGVYSLLSARNILGVTPRILIAPGFTNTKEVVTEMVTIANRLRAIIVADAPTDSDEELMEYISSCISSRVYVIYPQVLNTSNVAVPASPYVAGVIAKNDNENGFWCSPSNKTISGIVGLSKAVDFTLGDSACRANYLNEEHIATIVNQDGYRLWGNRSTEQDGSYKFLCVQRTADIIAESILQSHLWAVDRNIVKNYLVDVSENVNAFLAGLKAQGAILAGKCYPNTELNTGANISEGNVYFDYEFTPAYPAEHVTFRAYLNNDDIESLLLENLAQ